MPYSAVTQPRPWPFSQGGRRSSRVAVTSTWVSPNLTRHEPSAYFTTPRSSDTARSSSALGGLAAWEILQAMRQEHRSVGSVAAACRARKTVGPDDQRCFAARSADGLADLAELETPDESAQTGMPQFWHGAISRANLNFGSGAFHGPPRSDRSLIAPNSELAQLNERSREIFRQIVESYLATGEPVGSRNMSRLIAVPLSPASVRNVMADLEQLGLIYAPHTSAGRLPTNAGLRFFVDALMQVGD